MNFLQHLRCSEKPNTTFHLTPLMLEQFLGIHIYMTLIKLGSSRRYWGTFTRVPQVADVMKLDQSQCEKSAMFTYASPKKHVFKIFIAINLYNIDVKFLNGSWFFAYLCFIIEFWSCFFRDWRKCWRSVHRYLKVPVDTDVDKRRLVRKSTELKKVWMNHNFKNFIFAM